MDGDERPWIGRRVWIVDIKGRRHHGTLWWNNGATVHVRIDTPEVVLVPVAARGERWGFIEDINPKSLRSR